jgi:hypothetical protein
MLGATSWARADSIELFDGHKLVGQVEGVSAKTVVFSSAESRSEIPIRDLTSLILQGSKTPDRRHHVPLDRKPNWLLRLAGGGNVSVRFRSWTERGVVVSTGLPGFPELTIPIEHVQSISSLQAPSHLPRESVDSRADEETIIAKVTDDRSTEVRGKVLGVQDGQLLVQYRGQTRKINLEKVLHYLRSQTAEPSPSTTYLLVSFGQNCVLPVHLESYLSGAISLRTTWDQPLELSLNDYGPLTFAVRNGRVQYLSDHEPARVVQTPFFDRIVSWRRDCALDGSPLIVGSQTYARGIAVHSQTHLQYDLNGRYERFMATVGIDQRMARLGDVTLQVLADDRVVFERDRLKGTDHPLELNIPLDRARQLTLVVGFGEGQDVGDQVLWANARLVTADNGL